jgi:hypothetical protein
MHWPPKWRLLLSWPVGLGVGASCAHVSPDTASAPRPEPAAAYRVHIETRPDSLNQNLRESYVVLLDLAPRPINPARLGTDTRAAAIEWNARRIEQPNACYYELPRASGSTHHRRAGLARWSLDSSGDSIDVLMEVGTDNGSSIRFPRGVGVVTGRLQWWGNMVLSATPVLNNPNVTMEESKTGQSMGGAVSAVRIGSSDIASCIAAVRQNVTPRL